MICNGSFEVTNESTAYMDRGKLAKWRQLALTTASYGVPRKIVLINGKPRLCTWTSYISTWLGRHRDSNTNRAILTDLAADLDVKVAEEVIRLYHLDSRPITNCSLRSLFDWLDVVRRTRPIQLTTAAFDRMISQLRECNRVELTVDQTNLLFCHLVACQTKSPDQFTQAVAEDSLGDALTQLQEVSIRLRDQLTQPNSPAFKRIFAVAIAQNPQLKVVGPNTGTLRCRVAALARDEILEPQLITRHQLVAQIEKILVRLAAEEDSVRITPNLSRGRPDTKLIKLTQLSPDQLPD